MASPNGVTAGEQPHRGNIGEASYSILVESSTSFGMHAANPPRGSATQYKKQPVDQVGSAQATYHSTEDATVVCFVSVPGQSAHSSFARRGGNTKLQPSKMCTMSVSIDGWAETHRKSSSLIASSQVAALGRSSNSIKFGRERCNQRSKVDVSSLSGSKSRSGARSQIILVYCTLPAKHWCVACTL